MRLLLTFILAINLVSCAQKNDKIIGIWEVTNEYYQAVYEIVEYRGKFFGKIHYYNDGKLEYQGKNKKRDYFLTDVEKQGNTYKKAHVTNVWCALAWAPECFEN